MGSSMRSPMDCDSGGSVMPFRASVLTLYPDMFPGPLGASLAGRALDEGIWSLEATNIRDFATDKHRSVDDTPAGGGAGMVLRPDVLAAAVDSVADGRPILALTPRGAPLTQERVRVATPRSSHDPPTAALRGSCALPMSLVGYSADIREAPSRSSPPHRWRPRPLPRGAASRKRRG